MPDKKPALTKKDIFTIPNMLSVLRFVMVAVIGWLYSTGQELWAGVVLIVSVLTDMLDGFIARKFDMVTDLGKLLDPVADKVTQGVVFLFLASRHPTLWYVFGLFVVKEFYMLFMGSYIYKKTGKVGGAKWYGKVSTAAIMISIIAILLFPGLPESVVSTMIGVCFGVLFVSLIGYTLRYIHILRAWKQGDTEAVDHYH